MSAVAALWRFDGGPAREDIARMMQALRPYGPDAMRLWAQDGVGLAALRMTLLPEDRDAVQPVIGGGGDLVLATTIRLENRAELGRLLALDADRLRRMADANLLMLAIEAWGAEGALQRIRGPFTFLLWDGRARRLLCARDAIGQRALCYHHDGRQIAVATTPAGLFALPSIPRELDERAIARQLLLLPHQGHSPFQNVERVRAGHVLIATENGVRVERWWSPPAMGSASPASADEVAEEGRTLFRAAVNACLRSDHPFSAHLSGGCDSGAVTSFAAEALAERGARLTAYTAVPRPGYDGGAPEGKIGDEGPGAAEVARRHPNIDHVLVPPGDATPFDALAMIGMAQQAPLVNPCNMIWTAGISRAARQAGSRVILTGAAGNMTISHAGRERLPWLIAHRHFATWAREAAAYRRVQGESWRRTVRDSIVPLIPLPLWRWWSARRGAAITPYGYSAIAPDFLREIDAERLSEEAGWDMSYRPWSDSHAMRLALFERSDVGTAYAAIGASFGVDLRDPTADQRFVEYCLSLPEQYYLSGGVTKRLLRLIVGDRLPAETMNRPSGAGYQAVDWHEGLERGRDTLVDEIERLAQSPMASRVLDLPRLRRMVADWPRDGWHDRTTMGHYRLALLRGVSVGNFIRMIEGGNG